MEPEWTKAISSETICNFFYVFFVIYAVLAGLLIIYIVGLVINFKKLAAVGLPVFFQAIFIFGLAVVQLLFHYLICSRALLGTQKA